MPFVSYNRRDSAPAREESPMTRPRILSRMFAALLPLAVAACAATSSDCSRELDAASGSGNEGRWLEFAIDGVDPACRNEATEAWLAAAGALDCSPRFAFAAARLGHEVDSACASTAYIDAARLGRMLGELERELAAIDAELEDQSLAATAQRDLRQRRVTIERDLPQLEGLARFDDLLPPIAIPDQPN
jgi:hypothetical protein